MADTKQLQTTRVAGSDAGNVFDDDFNNMEAAVVYIFGMETGESLSQAMEIDSGGNVTLQKRLYLASAPTSNLHAATKKYVDDNAGAGGSFDRLVVYSYSVGLSNSAYASLEFLWADIETDDAMWDSSAREKLNILATGKYLVGFRAEGRRTQPVSNKSGWALRLTERSVADDSLVTTLGDPVLTGWIDDDNYNFAQIASFQGIFTLSADNYLLFEAVAMTDDPSPTLRNMQAWMVRLS